ncbi:hypothetical protein NDU88_003514 [Pleurodeles waltl]|uniref:Secreted protein n=1 Tax=Pleurodeles waltl TaxID=8319 RepID=A0AAV7W774_PLEWA|nr:hypothetical protein NDU88_003514 [Pleurodeles waltl]
MFPFFFLLMVQCVSGVVLSRNVKCHKLRACAGGSLHTRTALLSGTASSQRRCRAPLSAVLAVDRGGRWARAAPLTSAQLPGLGSRWAEPRSVRGQAGCAPPRVVGVGGSQAVKLVRNGYEGETGRTLLFTVAAGLGVVNRCAVGGATTNCGRPTLVANCNAAQPARTVNEDPETV